ncbi:MAG: c-type cytochrome [Candidatus Nitrospinota bacterium M3_3B_026]
MMRIIAAAMGIAAMTFFAIPAQAKELTAEQAEGKKIYDRLCAGCHGEKGEGDGPAADRLRPRPRNFKIARYKFTYTPFGKMPHDSTLRRWIAEGLPGSSMPGWKDKLSDKEIDSVIEYIKTFSRRFMRKIERGKIAEQLKISSPPEWTAEDIEQGGKLFQKNCEKCHGGEGRGSGLSAVALKHDLGDRIWPRNLTKGWTYRGGNSPGDIFRTIATGITGTPMPAHLSTDPGQEGAMTEEEIWKVVGFVDSIVRRERPEIKEVVVSRFDASGPPESPDDTRWSEIEPRYFPLVSQIIEGERWFKTTLESVSVRSMYGEDRIAILVEWDDPSQSPLPKPNDKFPVNEPDALAVQLPTEIPEGMEKPYFLGGDEKSPVILWKWTNGVAAEVIRGKGILKTEPMPGETQTVKVNAVYNAGRWKAVFTRPLMGGSEGDISFEPGRYIPIAFSAWDGNNGEKDERRAVSIWYWLLLEPPKTMTVYLFPAIVGLLIAASEAALVMKTRNTDKR